MTDFYITPPAFEDADEIEDYIKNRPKYNKIRKRHLIKMIETTMQQNPGIPPLDRKPHRYKVGELIVIIKDLVNQGYDVYPPGVFNTAVIPKFKKGDRVRCRLKTWDRFYGRVPHIEPEFCDTCYGEVVRQMPTTHNIIFRLYDTEQCTPWEDIEFEWRNRRKAHFEVVHRFKKGITPRKACMYIDHANRKVKFEYNYSRNYWMKVERWDGDFGETFERYEENVMKKKN